jgi:hypothetical protein
VNKINETTKPGLTYMLYIFHFLFFCFPEANNNNGAFLCRSKLYNFFNEMSRSTMQYRCLKSLINLSIDIMTPQAKIRRSTGPENKKIKSGKYKACMLIPVYTTENCLLYKTTCHCKPLLLRRMGDYSFWEIVI